SVSMQSSSLGTSTTAPQQSYPRYLEYEVTPSGSILRGHMPPPRLPLAPSLAHSTMSDFSDGLIALGSTERLSVRQKATDKSRSSQSIDRLLTPSQKLVFEAMHHTIFKHLMFI